MTFLEAGREGAGVKTQTLILARYPQSKVGIPYNQQIGRPSTVTAILKKNDFESSK